MIDRGVDFVIEFFRKYSIKFEIIMGNLYNRTGRSCLVGKPPEKSHDTVSFRGF